MTELTERIDRFEDRLRSMELELTELRRLVRRPEPEASPARPPEQETPLWELLVPEPEPAAVPPVVAPPREEQLPPTAVRPRRDLDLSVLFGARALAWTGGSVTLLGIVFFFVLAVQRGWIGPTARIALGAAASIACLAAGAWLHRRFGDTYASVSAAGAGVAGLYATLLAATALYDLVPRPTALAVAAGIAALGAVLAIAWNAQTLAALGLLGAVLVPLPIALQDGHLSPVGTTFAVLVLAGAIVVTVPRGWTALQVVTTIAATLEAFALVLAHEPRATAVAGLLWAVSGAGALWPILRGRVTYVSGSLVLLTAVFAGWSAGILYDGDARGYALLVVAAAYGAVSTALWRRDRDAAAVLWALALGISGIGAAALLSDGTLTVVWAAEAATLGFVARRVDEPRFQLAALGWLTLAYVHGIGIDASPTKLFVENADTWPSALSAAALAGGTTAVGLFTFRWTWRDAGPLTRLLQDLNRAQGELRQLAFALAGTAALYAGSLFVVTLPASWDWGHVAVAGLWAGVAVGLVAAARRRPAFAVLTAATLLVVVFDLTKIAGPARWWSFALVGSAAVVVAVVAEWRAETDTADLPAVAALAASVGLSSAAAWGLLDGHALGGMLLLVAAGYAAIATGLLERRRDFASVAGACALGLAVPASVILLDGTWLVLAWTAAAAALATLAVVEERLLAGALAYLALALAHTLVFEAKPTDLFVAARHPGTGIAALLLVAAAVAVVARRVPALRDAGAWVGGTLVLFALTLGVLELFETGTSDVHAAFQRGHTAVSALWGIVGLVLLVGGLKRGRHGLRIGGFALFGVSLAKLFLYDLAFLSSIARAGSFLAVGGLLLVGGFFYQRLTADSAPTKLHSAL